jgi:signal recognition particle subunit SRP54
MFSSLAERFQATFRGLRKKGHIGESDLRQVSRELKLAFLEADVNFRVVKEFIQHVERRALGEKVLKSLTPAQQVIGIVRDELSRIMGGDSVRLDLSGDPAVVMMVGLQGTGKTTSCAKLARFLKEKGHRPCLVGCDPYRPAACEQLKVLAEKVNCPIFLHETSDPLEIAKMGVSFARDNVLDVVLLDTAGRLHINEEMMLELERMRDALRPSEILLVLDSMTGQDAVRLAESFDKRLGLSGFFLTKVDGDSRGGAALSIKWVTGKPIKFIGSGEGIGSIELFDPRRVASRILGMGDILGLVERAERMYKKEEFQAAGERSEDFTLEDFLDHLRRFRKMGPLEEILELLPQSFLGLKIHNSQDVIQMGEDQLKRTIGIIHSMTRRERLNPRIINGSRRRRIAAGSGTTPFQVNQVLRQFEQIKEVLRRLNKKGIRGFPFSFFKGTCCNAN